MGRLGSLQGFNAGGATRLYQVKLSEGAKGFPKVAAPQGIVPAHRVGYMDVNEVIPFHPALGIQGGKTYGVLQYEMSDRSDNITYQYMGIFEPDTNRLLGVLANYQLEQYHPNTAHFFFSFQRPEQGPMMLHPITGMPMQVPAGRPINRLLTIASRFQAGSSDVFRFQFVLDPEERRGELSREIWGGPVQLGVIPKEKLKVVQHLFTGVEGWRSNFTFKPNIRPQDIDKCDIADELKLTLKQALGGVVTDAWRGKVDRARWQDNYRIHDKSFAVESIFNADGRSGISLVSLATSSWGGGEPATWPGFPFQMANLPLTLWIPSEDIPEIGDQIRILRHREWVPGTDHAENERIAREILGVSADLSLFVALRQGTYLLSDYYRPDLRKNDVAAPEVIRIVNLAMSSLRRVETRRVSSYLYKLPDDGDVSESALATARAILGVASNDLRGAQAAASKLNELYDQAGLSSRDQREEFYSVTAAAVRILEDYARAEQGTQLVARVEKHVMWDPGNGRGITEDDLRVAAEILGIKPSSSHREAYQTARPLIAEPAIVNAGLQATVMFAYEAFRDYVSPARAGGILASHFGWKPHQQDEETKGRTALAILDLSLTTDEASARRAFHRLSYSTHPDRRLHPRSEDIFKLVQDAGRVLGLTT